MADDGKKPGDPPAKDDGEPIDEHPGDWYGKAPLGTHWAPFAGKTFFLPLGGALVGALVGVLLAVWLKDDMVNGQLVSVLIGFACTAFGAGAVLLVGEAARLVKADKPIEVELRGPVRAIGGGAPVTAIAEITTAFSGAIKGLTPARVAITAAVFFVLAAVLVAVPSAFVSDDDDSGDGEGTAPAEPTTSQTDPE